MNVNINDAIELLERRGKHSYPESEKILQIAIRIPKAAQESGLTEEQIFKTINLRNRREKKMLNRVIRLLEENLTYERAHLAIKSEKEHSEGMICQIEKAIVILKLNIPERLNEMITGEPCKPRMIQDWADIGVDLSYDLNLLIKEINNA